MLTSKCIQMLGRNVLKSFHSSTLIKSGKSCGDQLELLRCVLLQMKVFFCLATLRAAQPTIILLSVRALGLFLFCYRVDDLGVGQLDF